MFSDANYFNQPLNNWNVSNVTNMYGNQDLKRLPEDVFGEIREMHPLLTPKLTNVTLIHAVKDYLKGNSRSRMHVVHKYGDISQWDVSNVTDMGGMFGNASSFNQPLNN
jgi:surface protein